MSKWFLEAMQNAVLAGHITPTGALKVIEALEREDDEELDRTCKTCGEDKRDIYGECLNCGFGK